MATRPEILSRFEGEFDAVLIGHVIGYEDEADEKFGRVRVIIPGMIDRPGKLAFPGQTFSGCDGRGIWMLPKVGANVLCFCLLGDPSADLYYLAGPWGSPEDATGVPIEDRPDESEDSPDVAVIRFDNWFIAMDARDGAEKLTIKDRTSETYIEIDTPSGGDLTSHCKNDETQTVDNDLIQTVERDKTVHVKRDEITAVDGDKSLTVGGQETRAITSHKSETVGGNKTIQVTGSETRQVTQGRTTTIGTTDTENVGTAKIISAGTTITISAGGAVSISAGGVLTLTAPGITVNSTVGAPSNMQSVGIRNETFLGGILSTIVGAVTKTITGAVAYGITGTWQVIATVSALINAPIVNLGSGNHPTWNPPYPSTYARLCAEWLIDEINASTFGGHSIDAPIAKSRTVTNNTKAT